MSNLNEFPNGEAAAYRQGWRAGLAVGSLALAIVAFINLLSLEKSLLAIALALIAIRGAGPGRARTRGRLALAIAAAHLTLAIVAFVLFREKLAKLLPLLLSLG